MNLQTTLLILLFFSIFQIVGGTAVGIGLRGVLKRDWSERFLLSWGLGFGGIPTLMSLVFTLDSDSSWVVCLSPLIFLSAIGFGLFVMPHVRLAIDPDALIKLVLGTIFWFVGLGIGAWMLRDGEYLLALLAGGIFSLVGGGMCISTVWQLLRTEHNHEN